MNKRRKGFTLAEMLIVVAIIGVLVAIVTPVLTKNLEKSREATDLANLRAAVSMVQNAYINDDIAHKIVNTKVINQVYYDKYSTDGSEWYCVKIFATQKKGGWQSGANAAGKFNIAGYDTSASIYGWTVLIHLNGDHQGEFLINGMSADGYNKLKQALQ